MSQLGKLACLAFVSPLLSWSQAVPPTGTPAEFVVTVGHFYSKTPPTLRRDDLVVTQRFAPVEVTNLVPLRGDRASLELFVLVDNCSNCEAGSKFEELRRFIDSQPSTTAIGVAYIDGGRLKVAQTPTPDRDRAVKALSAPAGSSPSSPFGALRELIQGWPRGASQRAVLLISNGIDPAADSVYQSPSAEAALEAAQRGGITVYAIYHPSADYLKSDFSKLYSGQVELSHVADETGGEAYFLGFGPLPSLAPLLADLADHLANRYLVQFLAQPEDGPGGLQEVIVKSKIPELDLVAPDRVWIPGRQSGPSGTNDPSKAKRP
jgi:hypothetical protein